MKRWNWLLTVLILIVGSVYAGENDPAVKWNFTVEAPSGYSIINTITIWSSDSKWIAIRFNRLDENQFPHDLWHVYETATGKKVYECAEFIQWYQDSRHIMARIHEDDPPAIINLRTGTVDMVLKHAGTRFKLRDNLLIDLDDQAVLRVYDTDTDTLKFSLSSVEYFPNYSPDDRSFAVNIIETGIQIYDALDFSLKYRLDGYRLMNYIGQVWSPDSEHLIVIPVADFRDFLGPYYLWTPATGLSAPIYNVTSAIVWSPDSASIAVPSDFTKVRLYDSSTGQLIQTIRGYADGSTYIAGWEGHYLYAESGDHRAGLPSMLTLWDLDRNKFAVNTIVDLGYEYWLENDEIVIREPFVGIKHISLATGATTRTVKFEKPLFYSSLDHHWLAGSEFSVVDDAPVPLYIYRLDPLELIATLEGHTSIVKFISWSPDSLHFASVGGPDTVIVWKMMNGQK